MRPLMGLHLKIIRWPIVAVFYIAVVLCSLEPAGGEFVIFGLEKALSPVAVNYAAFSRWLLMMCVPVLVNGYYLERCVTLETFIRLRMRKRSQFSIFMTCGCVFNSVIWALSLYAGGVLKFGAASMAGQLILLLPNLLFWTALTVRAYLGLGRAPWSGPLCVAIIGCAHLLGEYVPALERFMPSAWGMRCRSSFDSGGYISALYMITMSVLLCAAVFLYWPVAGQNGKGYRIK